MTDIPDSKADNDDLIVIDGVTHTYKTNTGPLPVLNDLTVRVPRYGFSAIVGPSGCGKSTVTRLVAGLMKPDAGTVWLQGERVTSPRSTVGMAFQNPVLLEWRSILKNVMLPLEIVPSKLNAAAKERRAREVVYFVALWGFVDTRPSDVTCG